MSIMINLVDARRGLQERCNELFSDERIADNMYQYLCDGIEECPHIDTEKLIEAYTNIGYERGIRDGYADPIVRCGDCKWYRSRCCPAVIDCPSPDDCCPNWKRKDDVEE